MDEKKIMDKKKSKLAKTLTKKIVGVPVFLVLLAVFASAAILATYVTAQGTATVKQSVTFSDGEISKTASYDGTTLFAGDTIWDEYELENHANVSAPIDLVATCNTYPSCEGITTTFYEYFDGIANFADYTPPSLCDATVANGESIQTAVDGASIGDVICVKAGTYDETVTIDKSITLASKGNISGTTITGGVRINASNVTIQGFTINPSKILGEKTSIYLTPILSNIEISYNELVGQKAGDRGIMLGLYSSEPNNPNANYSNVLIEHNKFHNLTTGIYTNSHMGTIIVRYNEIWNTTAGIGGFTGADVQYNTFSDNTEAIGADSSYGNATLQHNNFLGSDTVKDYGATSLDARDNWWDTDGINTTGTVTASYAVKGATTIPSKALDKFYVKTSFDVALQPGNYTITTRVIPN